MSDTNHHVLTGKVDITSNLLVGSSHLFVDTQNNRVGLVTANPDAGLHVNSNVYVNTDVRVGPAGPNQVIINDSANPGRIVAKSFVGDGSGLNNVPLGPAGPAATVDVGTTTTGAAGSSASVTNSGTTSAAVFDFTIPRGDQGIQGIQGIQGVQGVQGAQGPSGTITVGTVTTVTNSSGASVTNSGTSENAVLNFNIPVGADSTVPGPIGPIGPIGPTGATGADGTNYFTLSGSNIYRSTGNVGIGGTNPSVAKLHIGPFDNDHLYLASANDAYGWKLDTDDQGNGAVPFRIKKRTGGVDTTVLTIKNEDGYVGVGVTSPDNKLEVRGNIQASWDDTNHGFILEAGGTLRRDYGGYGAGFHFTNVAIWPTNYLGSYNNGGIDFGSSSYRWNNVYTERVDATSTITLGTSASIRQPSSTWTGNPGTYGKLEYHNRTWYAVSGSNSNNIMIFRRDGSDQSFISNEGNLMRTSHSNGYLVGSYNNVGSNDAKTNPIYTIGNNYRPNDTSLVNMYGIGYTHGNFTAALRSNEGYGWGLYVAADGDARIGLNGGTGSIKMICEENGDSYAWEPANDGWLRLQGAAPGQGNMYGNYTALAVGNFWSAGATRFSSDDRVKHFEEEIPNCLELINQLKPYKYKKTGKIYTEDYTGEIGEEGKDWDWEIGLIAQDVEKIPYFEHTVSKPEDGAEGKYGLNYTQFISVCIQGIKDLGKELQSEKKKAATMELLVASLLSRVGDLEKRIA